MGRVGQADGGRSGADTVRGGVQIERVANGRYQWQLKAPNGRIVAVSAMVHESPQEADLAFAALRGYAVELTARITHVRDGIGWIWVVPGPRGVPEARSSRAYERYATCQNAFRRFTALLERQPAGRSAARPGTDPTARAVDPPAHSTARPADPPTAARERSPLAGADRPGSLRPPRSGGDA